MQATVSFERLYLPHSGKDNTGKRQYIIRVIDEIDLRNIRACMLHAVGLSHLTGIFNRVYIELYPLCSRIGLKSTQVVAAIHWRMQSFYGV